MAYSRIVSLITCHLPRCGGWPASECWAGDLVLRADLQLLSSVPSR